MLRPTTICSIGGRAFYGSGVSAPNGLSGLQPLRHIILRPSGVFFPVPRVTFHICIPYPSLCLMYLASSYQREGSRHHRSVAS